MNFEPRRNHDDGPQDEIQNKYANEFCELGGVDVSTTIYRPLHAPVYAVNIMITLNIWILLRNW